MNARQGMAFFSRPGQIHDPGFFSVSASARFGQSIARDRMKKETMPSISNNGNLHLTTIKAGALIYLKARLQLADNLQLNIPRKPNQSRGGGGKPRVFLIEDSRVTEGNPSGKPAFFL